MKCPLLKDSSARYCQASPHRRLPREAISAANDRCTSDGYVDCPVLRGVDVRAGMPRCPLLEEQLVQYCAGAAVPKYIPYNEALLSRCNSEAHLYCPLYLARTRPGGHRRAVTGPDDPRGGDDPRRQAGLAGPPGAPEPPERFCYSPNHMWIDVAPDGSCHIGVDAFVSRVLGHVDRVRFLTGRGLQWPVASLEVRQTDLRLVFPRRIQVTASNVHLRSDPSALVDDPYGAGWLYSGFAGPHDFDESAGEPDLIRGAQVPTWMRSEADRLDRFVHDRLAAGPHHGGPSAADGGTVVPGVALHMDHEDLLYLFDAFFSLHGRRDA